MIIRPNISRPISRSFDDGHIIYRKSDVSLYILKKRVTYCPSNVLSLDVHITMVPPRLCVNVVMMQSSETASISHAIDVCEIDIVEIKERCQSVRIVILKHCSNSVREGHM